MLCISAIPAMLMISNPVGLGIGASVGIGMLLGGSAYYVKKRIIYKK